MKVNSPLEVYKYLPGDNCGVCGEETCMAFASKLINRSAKLSSCTPLLKDEYKDKFDKLEKLLAPEIREVEIGTGDNVVKIGGDDVLYRHKLTFFNRTALAYDVWDTMPENELIERVDHIADFKKFYVGEFLTADMVAIRSVSDDPQKFASTVEKVMKATDLPLVLCSFNPEVLKAGAEIAAERKPLLYAATMENWQQMADIAVEYDLPIALFSPNDLDNLKSLAKTFSSMGMDNLVLDPGTYPTGKELSTTFNNIIKIRRAGIEGDRDIAYPIMAVPLTSWLVHKEKVTASYWETVIASVFTIKYGDIMILHSTEPYAMIPELQLGDTIYTDPRKPVTVDPGVYEVGSPTADSPLIITTNFALTYYTVESDLSSNGIDSYLVAVDTDGIGVEAAVAGGQLTASKIKQVLEESSFDLKEKTSHNTVILPGLAARLQGDVEDQLGSNVLIGSADSGRLPGWMDKYWPPEK
ncbi:CO dehydrogenase/acetyl-CoA synthase delta subunit, TIM barrel [Methanosalsum zhilinae DSM 4017]|uniref:Acetyl-CoA decarbonylase/synthase complex subunit gamma n=1 Tax=Methanosalsum zhilinae (strain DSM 4017 / NBRC 107636 / OCM 62 / WeN5) TaxID=679901 RepID=F7XM98_METZD|nr:acetyl-CoA decarbonylase/synthase complex subunit gamma [Methanosalsum zhilinae]AEH60988.1 CO dehydrogenase/acetyl-CoA synthase delta subunit, TIM barrel [Methanosalsum zhilinae DSM 4017]